MIIRFKNRIAELRRSFVIFLLITAFSLFFFPIYGQTSSNFGRFEADFTAGCAPFKIILTETDTFPPETVRQYDFENDGFFVGFEPGEEISFTYDTAGIYRIIQVINIDITPKTDTLTIEVYPFVAPDFEVFTCEGRAVKIEILEDQYDLYTIYFTPSDSVILAKGDNVPPFTYSSGQHQVAVKGMILNGRDNCGVTAKTFNTINNLTPAILSQLDLMRRDNLQGLIKLQYNLGVNVIYQLENAVNIPAGFISKGFITGSSLVVDSLNTSTEIQIFRIAAYDACQQKYLYSDTLASIRCDVTAENNQNRVEWETYPVNFTQYDLNRDNQAYQEFNNPNVNFYLDKGVKCFDTYCYSISMVNGNGHKSFSDTLCIEAFSIYFPPAIRNTTTSAEQDDLELSWIPPENISVQEFFIQRLVSEDVYSTIDTTIAPVHLDTGILKEPGSKCYRISYLDQCNNRSNLGEQSCSIFLVLENENRLAWNYYKGWSSGARTYFLETYGESGEFKSEQNLGIRNSFEVGDFYQEQVNFYRIRAESDDAEPFVAFSNMVVKNISSVINAPNSFTPNGDGLNDLFRPEGTEMKEYHMKIFNQFGNLLFETSDQNSGWDGTYNGQPVPSDSYIFDIFTTDFNEKKYRLQGSLYLIRH